MNSYVKLKTILVERKTLIELYTIISGSYKKFIRCKKNIDATVVSY